MKYVLSIGICLMVLSSKANLLPIEADTDMAEIDSAKILNNSGIKMYRKGDFESAIRFFYQSVSLKRKLNYDSVRIANSLLNIGVIYRNIWEYDKAIEILNKAETMYRNNLDSNKVSVVLLNKGNVYADIGDHQKALETYRQAIHLTESADKHNFRRLSIMYNNLGSNYKEIGELNRALESFKKSIDLLNKSGTITVNESVFKNIANSYALMDSNKLAEHYYRRGLSIYEQTDDASFKKGHFLFDYGKFLVQAGNKTKGFSYIHQGGEFIRKIYGQKHPVVANYFMEIGQIYLNEEDYKTAIKYFQEALVALIPEFNNEDIFQNPERTDRSQDIVLLAILKRKSKAMYQLYTKTSDSELLTSGYQAAMTGLDILEDLKKGYVSEKSKMVLMRHEKDFYPIAMLTALKLHEETGYVNYKEDAFLISERSKASILLASLKTINARAFGGIPENLIQREYQLKKKIAFYDERIYEESKFYDSDSNRIKFWENKLYGLKNQYYKLIDTFENQYPGYYELKYKPETITSKMIQNIMASKEAVVEYTISENTIISFVLTKNNFYYHIDTVNKTFHKTLAEVIQFIGNNNFTNHNHQKTESYISKAGTLYSKLIGPHKEIIKNKSLIIVPDGQLAYLPFEILVAPSSDKQDNTKKYDSYPYLIKKHPVSYAHSSTLLYKSKSSPIDYRKELLAFAPKYDYPGDLPKKLPIIRQQYLDQLYPLPGSKEEVHSINKIIGGQVFIDENATEHNFKQNAGKYDILHLAMHTIVDTDDPMYTKMVFTQTNDSVEDNFLNTYELYNMNLSARMAVLSSCNTGKGRLQKGEGVISLARGFMYAGCPSVTMSLWEVEDKSGSILMKYYYEFLKKGESKAEALQSAKLKFLDGADPLKSHPYFWSGFVVIGNHDSLFRNNFSTAWMYGVILLMTLTGAGLYFRYRKQHHNNAKR